MREINHLSIHQWLRSAIPDSQQPTSPIGFLFLKLPPPPCAVLLVLESLHKVLPSTTLYYEACTGHFPVLLCTTKLAQSTSQYHFVLQRLHKPRPSTTVYYKACKKYFSVLFVLQGLHKVFPSTTLYYKACTKYFPVLPCTTKLAQRKLLHTASTHNKLLHREAFTHSKLLHTASVYTQETFTHSSFTHGKRLQTQKLSHREAFTYSKLLHTKSCTRSKLLQKKVFTQRSFLVYNDNRNCSSKTGWILAPKQKKHHFEALFKRNFTRKIASTKMEKIC